MATVEPIRNKKDIQKVEKILAKQGTRELLLFMVQIADLFCIQKR